MRGGCNISRLVADQISVNLTFLVVWQLFTEGCHGFVTGFSTGFGDNWRGLLIKPPSKQPADKSNLPFAVPVELAGADVIPYCKEPANQRQRNGKPLAPVDASK